MYRCTSLCLHPCCDPCSRSCSRKEPSALNRGPSPRASPSGTPSPGKPQPFEPQPAHPQQRQQVQEKPVEAGQTRMLSVQRAAHGEPPSPPENEGGVRVSSHLIPLDESNYTDAVALKVGYNHVLRSVRAILDVDARTAGAHEGGPEGNR